MRKSTRFFLFTGICSLVIATMVLHAGLGRKRGEEQRRYRLKLVNELMLTDLSLFTEARYTRHLSMADNHAAFQDHPLALEHFPSGALTQPPIMINGTR